VGDGTVESVTALTRDDILAAHAAVLARDRIFVAASGDVTAEELAVLLDRLFGALPASGAAQQGDAELRFAGGTTVIDFPSPQSTVLFGQKGIARDDPDFFAAFILNEALGGGRFTARLMSEIREKRGLTYGIGTYLLNMDHADMLMGQFSASNDKVAEAIAVLKAEWQKAATEGISEAELEATKTYLVGSYPLRFNGNGAIAGILVGMQMDGLPIDYAVTRNAKIEAVTMDDIRRVAARLIDPNGLLFVVVGQPEGL
nr:pitrilysin family protein [Tabrizicola sp.]